MSTISLRDAIRIVRPEYVFLKLKPNNSIRNNNTHKIARAIASLYKNVLENVKKEEHRATRILGKQFFIPTKVSLETSAKVSYFIYIEKKKVEFYFIAPKQHLSVIKEKIGDVWTSITVEEVDSLPEFGKDATKYQLSYTKEDALSLNVDRRDNDLLRSTLNVVDVMEDGDRAGVFYNFIPVSQFSWRSTYKHTIEKVKSKKPVDRNKLGTSYVFKMAVSFLVGTVDAVTSVFSDTKKVNSESPLESLLERLNGGVKISDSTQRKATANILDTQIIVMSKSEDALRQRNNAKSLARTFDSISEDNELTHRSYKGEFKYTDRLLRGAAVNKVGDEECQSFISMAGRELLEQHQMIERVETQETEVPEDLQEGGMCVGTNRYRGNDQQAFLSTDKEYKNLPLILIGPQRAGKSTLIGNLSNDALNAGECVFIFDFIASCQLSSEVATLFPKDKTLVIDCEDPMKIEGLGYNEVGVSLDPFQQYDNAKKQTTQIKTLINSVNANGNGDTNLSAKMERYLESASNVVFVSGGSVTDVFKVLQNHVARHKFIDSVPESQHENLSENIDSLFELDEYKDVKVGEGNNKKTIQELCGTKDHLITGVIDRLNKLKANTFMEAMLKKSTAGNINLANEMQKNQLIILRMPETMFSTDQERDVYTTYWMTKLWMASQIREKMVGGDRTKLTKVNFIIDELYQVENTQKFLSDKLSRLAKFGVKAIISAHYLNQIKHIRDELRSSNASYMLISGCDKKNFNELQSELHPFTEEDLLKLPRYNSMNLLKSKDGYARFITKLPKPI
ncbi:type IV secretion system DNA-binding domain-containing protein [Paenibacillus sp. 2RAB27]|uniref:type IV secretion system DNA-binding domain-containing protein n=1 Tax=Paenibacillus sp. 2RAB27 TaxID=3232991 RepID=UPI003F97F901